MQKGEKEKNREKEHEEKKQNIETKCGWKKKENN